jgi:alkanesulfonate monooxygenase SsuD/methylene tetrahydromethanopterin reductase-like flavin-dependent oxidoreductase (luciferase family)
LTLVSATRRIAQLVRKGLLILGDLLPDPATGVRPSEAARHRQFVELAVRAEAVGFDSVWLGEHHLCDYILSAPPVVLAAIAERTERLRLGTGVTLLGSLDPLRAAEDYATVDALSGGRLELVVGRGVLRRTYRDFGLDPDRSRQIFAENLELLLALWSQENVSWRGSFRAPLDGVTLRPRPVQRPHPPVWVGGGSSVESVELAARLGLPLMLPSVLAPPRAFEPLVRRYREAWQAAGRDPAAASVGACSHVHVARDSQTARERWRPYHMSYISWVIGLIRDSGANLPGAEMAPGPAFEALVQGPSICGSPAEVAERIAEMRALLGLDLHLAMFDHGGIPEKLLMETLDLFGAEVLPLLSD